jgi:hypothetical protein
MKKSIRLTILVLLSLLTLPGCEESGKEAGEKRLKMHITTDWQMEPSFKFDVLCFLNTATGDNYYLNYYQDEYDRFEPKLTHAAKEALTNLKRKIKDEEGGIISAFLTLYFSANEDETLDDMIKTVENSDVMRNNLRKTPYYSEDDWQIYESVREDLKTIFLFLKDIQFNSYWEENILPKVKKKITEIEKELPKYNVIKQQESHLGFALPSNRITIYMLSYSQPHGIKITGTRFLTDVAWPFEIVLRNAVHEMMHPPYDLPHDLELREALSLLKEDEFLMDKVLNHNPAYGYNSFDGFIEEDCVQALEQIINEKLGMEREAHQRWKESDEGMHVFAVALYNVMKEENYNERGELFRDFLVRMIRSGKLGPGKIKGIYDDFYSEWSIHQED